MNVTRKRLLASRVLLAVLLPMLLLSAVHIHPHQPSAAARECADCVGHHCGGHISQQVAAMHDCVLCQFLSLPMAAGQAVEVTPTMSAGMKTDAQCQPALCSLDAGIIVTRGPPAV